MMFCLAFFAAMFMVETVLDDGVKTSETVEVPGSGDVVRFVWPKAKVPANFKSITVTPDFASAKKGEEGYWVMPDNTYGTFRLDKGLYRQSWHIFMPMFGMKTPRTAYCAIVSGMPHSLAVEAKAVEVRSDGAWTQVASEMENWRHMVRHRFEKRKIDAVRITCFETWGDSSAQIFEVRVY